MMTDTQQPVIFKNKNDKVYGIMLPNENNNIYFKESKFIELKEYLEKSSTNEFLYHGIKIQSVPDNLFEELMEETQ